MSTSNMSTFEYSTLLQSIYLMAMYTSNQMYMYMNSPNTNWSKDLHVHVWHHNKSFYWEIAI